MSSKHAQQTMKEASYYGQPGGLHHHYPGRGLFRHTANGLMGPDVRRAPRAAPDVNKVQQQQQPQQRHGKGATNDDQHRPTPPKLSPWNDPYKITSTPSWGKGQYVDVWIADDPNDDVKDSNAAQESKKRGDWKKAVIAGIDETTGHLVLHVPSSQFYPEHARRITMSVWSDSIAVHVERILLQKKQGKRLFMMSTEAKLTSTSKTGTLPQGELSFAPAFYIYPRPDAWQQVERKTQATHVLQLVFKTMTTPSESQLNDSKTCYISLPLLLTDQGIAQDKKSNGVVLVLFRGENSVSSQYQQFGYVDSNGAGWCLLHMFKRASDRLALKTTNSQFERDRSELTHLQMYDLRSQKQDTLPVSEQRLYTAKQYAKTGLKGAAASILTSLAQVSAPQRLLGDRYLWEADQSLGLLVQPTDQEEKRLTERRQQLLPGWLEHYSASKRLSEEQIHQLRELASQPQTKTLERVDEQKVPFQMLFRHLTFAISLPYQGQTTYSILIKGSFFPVSVTRTSRPSLASTERSWPEEIHVYRPGPAGDAFGMQVDDVQVMDDSAANGASFKRWEAECTQSMSCLAFDPATSGLTGKTKQPPVARAPTLPLHVQTSAEPLLQQQSVGKGTSGSFSLFCI